MGLLTNSAICIMLKVYRRRFIQLLEELPMIKKALFVVLVSLLSGSFLLAMKGNDPFDLNRFKKAQDKVYTKVLNELKSGNKTSHWMWYIFPQLKGLAESDKSKLYAIKSVAEAQDYLKHPVLGQRLRECTEILLGLKGRTAYEIFGSPDTMKLQSSVSLFAAVSDDRNSVFAQVLERYFQGKHDTKTQGILENLKQPRNIHVKSKPDKAKNQEEGKFAAVYKGIFLVSSLLVLYLAFKYWYP